MSDTVLIETSIEACLAAGIGEFVICAGARNLPIVTALAELTDIQVWSHFDERAAGFFALGRIMDSGYPCAVITTSGTAVAELLPSVIEAHYQQRPLVVITADRPKSYRGTGAPQAIEQAGIFGPYVEHAVDLDASESADDVLADWSGASPYHINLCLDEPSLSTEWQLAGELADFERVREPLSNVTELVSFVHDHWRGLVVMLGGLEPEDTEEVLHFLKELGAPVIADATSGLREQLGKLALVQGDALLKATPPGKVLRIGEVPVGRFWRDLENMPDVDVLSVTRTGFSGLSRPSTVVTGGISRCLRGMGEPPKVGDVLDILRLSKRNQAQVLELLEAYPESEPGMIYQISMLATEGESVYLGNSLPIREWNDFAQREIPHELVRANRGANGIDGQISSWLGTTAVDSGAWGIFGDLTTMYDLSSMAILPQINREKRVLVVINNGGGRIFEQLPAVRELDEALVKVIANEHKTHFSSWAEMWGLDYHQITGIEQLDVELSEETSVIEVIPDAKQTAAFWQSIKRLSS